MAPAPLARGDRRLLSAAVAEATFFNYGIPVRAI
jgi:hypothetical protein